MGLPGPLPWLLLALHPAALLLLLPDIAAPWHTRKVPVAALVCVGAFAFPFSWLAIGVVTLSQLTMPRQVVHLENPGPYQRALIVAGPGSWKAYVLRRDGEWLSQEPRDYPPCEWPFVVRNAAVSPRYLVVDSRLRASALLDLGRGEPVWAIMWELPPVEDLSRDFGEDVAVFDLLGE